MPPTYFEDGFACIDLNSPTAMSTLNHQSDDSMAPLGRFSHSAPLSYGRRGLDESDDSDSSPEPEDPINDDSKAEAKAKALPMAKKPCEINTAHWKKKIARKDCIPRLQKSSAASTQDVATSSLETSNYVYPCPFKVLGSMIKQVKEHDSKRYGEYLERETSLAETLPGLLREEALEVFKKGSFDLESLLSIGGTIPEGNAIYLHLVCSPDRSIIYLYVGQSTETMIRIHHHNDPDYRKRHPSLHYFVWDKLGPDAGSAWVILSAPEVPVDALALNLLEMWNALIVQSLPKETMIRYLANEILSPRAGLHLNVASPLDQCVLSVGPTQEGLGDLYNSEDPIVREFYKMRQMEWHAPQFSKDPILHEYWADARRRAIVTNTETRRNILREAALKGTRISVCSNQTSHFCNQPLYIRKAIVKLDTGKQLFIQCFFSEKPDPVCFASEARPDDDASRVVIRIRGVTDNGGTFSGWVDQGGEQTVKKLNFIYDMLVGRTQKESLQLPRRLLCRYRRVQNVANAK